MKIVKPLTLGTLTRPFEARGQCHLAVSVLATIPLSGPARLFPDHTMWKMLPDILGSSPVLDTGMPKSRAEFLVGGRAFPPERPAKTCPVEVALGGLEKKLQVVGDRYWRDDVPTEAQPFESMDVSWANAFGGEGYAKNPEGKGVGPVDYEGGELYPLPNVEAPGSLLRSPSERPSPAGFRALDFLHPDRARHRGTYDQSWLDNHYPSAPPDEDWRVWNVAPEDQQQESPFFGDEAYRVVNMHPEHPLMEGRLPALRGRAFAIRGEVGLEDNKTRPPGDLEEIALRLMTVWFLPEHDRAVLIWNGVMDVTEDDARDVRMILIAAERIGQERPVSHYSEVVDRRHDPEWGAMYALFDDELVPGDLPESVPMLDPDMRHAHLLKDNAKRGADRRRQEAEEMARERGLTLEELGFTDEAEGLDAEPPALRELPDKVRSLKAQLEEREARAEEDKREAMNQAERLCEEHGVDFEELRGSLDKQHTGPPDFRAEAHRQMLLAQAERVREHDVESPWLEDQANDEENMVAWQEQEEQLIGSYRVAAHLQAAAPRRSADDSRAAREALLAGIAAGESFENRDLTGLDFSGLDLGGANLDGALMESVSLRGASLDGASLIGTVLAHADLSEASARGAKMNSCNLGGATLRGFTTDEATDLSDAMLMRANGDGVVFTGAHFRRAILIEASFEGADFSGAQLTETIVVQAKFKGARFTGAALDSLTFLEMDLTGIDFSDASAGGVSFLTCGLEGANFARANLDNARFVMGCALARADFRFAKMSGANLRNADLRDADLSGTTLSGSDLSESDLRGANLYRTVARRSMWSRADLRGAQMMNADLMESILSKADIRGTDLRGANLYGVDFARVRGDSTTLLEGADQTRSQTLPRRSES